MILEEANFEKTLEIAMEYLFCNCVTEEDFEEMIDTEYSRGVIELIAGAFVRDMPGYEANDLIKLILTKKFEIEQLISQHR